MIFKLQRKMSILKMIPTNILAAVAMTMVIYTVFIHKRPSADVANGDVAHESKVTVTPSPPTTTDTTTKVTKTNFIVQHSIETPVIVLTTPRAYTKPTHPETIDGAWQMVKDTDDSSDIFLYSSYFDDRKTIEHPMVRIIGIINNRTQPLYCLLWYDQNATPDAVAADRNKAGTPYQHFGKTYQGEIISCGLPKDRGSPSQVSVVRDLKYEPSNSLLVKSPEKQMVPIDFGVCLGLSHGHLDPIMFIEWLEILKQWGVAEVTMYNNSISNETMYVINDYINQGFVVLYHAPSIFSVQGDTEDVIRLNLSPVLNDCMYRNLYRYRALISTEFGELIVPKTGTHYFEMLTDIQRHQPSRHPATTYLIRSAFFFMDLPPFNPESYLVTQKYLYRVPPEAYGVNGRSIVGPEGCVAMENHFCTKVVPKYDVDGRVIDVSTNLSLVHNYRYCDLDRIHNEPGLCAEKTVTIHRDESMTDFNDQLMAKTAEMLFKLNMEGDILGDMHAGPIDRTQSEGEGAPMVGPEAISGAKYGLADVADPANPAGFAGPANPAALAGAANPAGHPDHANPAGPLDQAMLAGLPDPAKSAGLAAPANPAGLIASANQAGLTAPANPAGAQLRSDNNQQVRLPDVQSELIKMNSGNFGKYANNQGAIDGTENQPQKAVGDANHGAIGLDSSHLGGNTNDGTKIYANPELKKSEYSSNSQTVNRKEGLDLHLDYKMVNSVISERNVGSNSKSVIDSVGIQNRNISSGTNYIDTKLGEVNKAAVETRVDSNQGQEAVPPETRLNMSSSSNAKAPVIESVSTNTGMIFKAGNSSASNAGLVQPLSASDTKIKAAVQVGNLN